MKYANSLFNKTLGSPILWGGLIAYVFYYLLHHGTIRSGILTRYLAMHPIEYVETIMFFIGMAALGIKGFSLIRHRGGLSASPLLPAITNRKVDTRSCESYLHTVEEFLRKHGPSYYPSRLFNALKYVRQCESAEQLDQELRFLADEDAMNSESDYGFVQLIIWAIPILGFLGTVVGIAVAMGNLNPEELENSLPTVMSGLTVAFDTTAIALAFSIILFSTKYWISRRENQLLGQVDRLINEELRGRFELIGTDADHGQILAVRKMLESLTQSVGEMFKMQCSTWEKAMNAANTRFVRLSGECSELVKTAFHEALRENMETHVQTLTQSEDILLKRTENGVNAINESMRQNLRAFGVVQENIVRQTEVFKSVVEATGQIAKLEERLNQNLHALSGSRNFEETVNSLAAVIHLLNSKFTSGESSIIQLHRNSLSVQDPEGSANPSPGAKGMGNQGKGYAA